MMNNEDLNIKAASTVRGLRLHAKAPSYDAIELPIETHPLRPLRPGEVLVEIHAAAVNPSDAKAATGLMPYAVFPRTPGRDFAGQVVAGPQDLIGKRVFGSSGDLGIRQNGSQASHMIVEADDAVVGVELERDQCAEAPVHDGVGAGDGRERVVVGLRPVEAAQRGELSRGHAAVGVALPLGLV